MRTLLALFVLTVPLIAQTAAPGWKLLSSKTGDLPVPVPGAQQTSATVFDIDGDRINDIVISERTMAPGVVWLRRTKTGWYRYVIDNAVTLIEAGAAYADIDGDGDLDIAVGGESRSNEIWWYENPAPNFSPSTPWTRHIIKKSGARKHHDLMFADIDGDSRLELVFWNQGGATLMMARIPANPKSGSEWPLSTIYAYSSDSEMQQRGTVPRWKRPNEHEGLAFADIDGDGLGDIVGGGWWFKRRPDGTFLPNPVDAAYHFSRSAAGQLKKGGRPEIVLVVGDGTGPLNWYEWVNGTWIAHRLADVDNAHSLAILDFDNDGNLDIFCAEMRLSGGNPASKTWILYGDGQGNFRESVIATGLDNHESKAADLDGDGDLDILVKPYNHETPALHVLLNLAKGQ
ncbi:MAG: VCBS repeat-containing protein [Bryobacteraceae bacterium]|nr:VCBS repeat-containing protein [Bryobacteraceae bacterium]